MSDHEPSSPPVHHQVGKVIQPSAEAVKASEKTVASKTPLAAEIYPDATKDVTHDPDARHSVSLSSSSMPNLADRTISSQVKVLLIYTIVGLVLTLPLLILLIVLILVQPNTPGLGASLVVVLVDIFVFAYLLLSKSANAVALVLKILLVLQVISVFGIFFGFGGGLSVFSIVGLLLTYLSLVGVRNLSRNNW